MVQNVRRLMVGFLAVGIVLTGACGGGDDDAKGTEDALREGVTDTTRGSDADDNELCGLFTAREIGQRLGTEVGEGRSAVGGSACQWSASGDADGYVQVQVIEDTEYWENPTGAREYEALSGIGSEAFVVPELDGFKAGALTDSAAVYVSIGGDAEKSVAVELLRETVERLA